MTITSLDMGTRKTILTVVLLAYVASIFGQAEFKKAEKLLNLKAFELAIKNYEEALAKYPDHAEGYAQLGEAYQMTNQLLEALKAYERAFSLEGEIDRKYKLQYAMTLKKVGLYDLAESVFFEYAKEDKAVANHMLASTEYAKSLLQKPDQYDVVNFGGNSEKSDFGVSFHNDNVIFSSFRTDLKRDTDKKNASHIQQAGNQIYKVKKDGADKSVGFLRPDFKEIYNIGPLSYSKDGRMVAFMRNTFTTGSNQIFSDESNMSIYVAMTSDNGDFADEKPFPYNQIEYSYAFPNLGFNGNALYFASNRPGGFGGFDIYVSYFRDGKWSEPENLGAEINSTGNEITPFFDGEQLYFASDFHFGLGGYDNFVSRVVDGLWTPADNLGKGINSPSDDYYLTPDMTNGTLYFTSNRLGGRGKDDIYVAYRIMADDDQIIALTETMPDVIPAEEISVPKAVNLEDLAAERQSDIAYTEVVASSPTVMETEAPAVVPVSEAATVAVISEAPEALLDFSDAKLVAITTPTFEEPVFDEYAEVYFIQLASLKQSEGNISTYDRLNAYGQLYRFFKPSAVKIRLGYYSTRNEAEAVLRDVKSNGFRDAFITREALATSSYEVLSSSRYNTDDSGWVNDYSGESNYKVKLASYQDPLKFKVDNVLDLGRLEQWSKGQWTIFILGGFESLEAAKSARIKAINRGFTDAELVEDDGGILQRVKEN